MPISSYVVRCAPENELPLLSRLSVEPGLLVGEFRHGGVPVVVDAASPRDAEEKGQWLSALPGVRSAVLVYHNFEDEVSGLKEHHENKTS